MTFGSRGASHFNGSLLNPTPSVKPLSALRSALQRAAFRVMHATVSFQHPEASMQRVQPQSPLFAKVFEIRSRGTCIGSMMQFIGRRGDCVCVLYMLCAARLGRRSADCYHRGRMLAKFAKYTGVSAVACCIYPEAHGDREHCGVRDVPVKGFPIKLVSEHVA